MVATMEARQSHGFAHGRLPRHDLGLDVESEMLIEMLGERDILAPQAQARQRRLLVGSASALLALVGATFYLLGSSHPLSKMRDGSPDVTALQTVQGGQGGGAPYLGAEVGAKALTAAPVDAPTNEGAAAAAAIQAGEDVEEAGCSKQGADCRKSRCCQAAGMQCFTKNEFWAQCREECEAGPDPTDQVSNSPWDCKALGEKTPGAAATCSGAGEDCRSTKCCKMAGTRCFAKDDTYAQCMVDCVPGPNLLADSPDPWQCAALGDVQQGAAAWVQETCAPTNADCRDQKCCKDSGTQCYSKNDYWGQCMPDCTQGMISPEWDKTNPWECGTSGSRTPAAAPGSVHGGVIGAWVPDVCAKVGENCASSQCCIGVDMQCYEKDSTWSTCRTACSTAPDPLDGNKTWSCQAIGPKGIGLALKGWPSLYCFSLLQTTGYESGLLTEQAKHGAGIFGCDGFTFVANGVISLGTPLGATQEVITVQIDTVAVGVSQDGTAANTLLFMKAWDEIIKQQRFRDYDWTVKVDPDAVLIPSRLRDHMRPFTGQNVYVVNCNKVPGSPNFPMMFGALEVFSNKAMDAYAAGSGVCGKDFWPSWQQWGEDYYMTHCLDHLGVGRISDFGVLGDNMCTGANCKDGWVSSFHPFKSIETWMQCWNDVHGIVPPPAAPAAPPAV